MSTPVPLPALGESVTEGTVSRWLKQVGDTVEVDEPIVEVSTDKVDTEIPSPAAGVILEIKVAEDETAAVGAVLAVIGDASEAGGDAAPEPAAPAAEPAPAAEAPAPAAPEPAAPAPAAGGAASGTEVKLPQLGESVTEGTISRWLKQVGDTVEADEPIVEVSTDKVDTEIPAPTGGVLLEIRVSEDETAAVGAVIAVIGEAGAAPAAAPAAAAPAPTPAPAPAAPAAPAPAAPAPAAAPAAAAPAAETEDVGYVTPLVRKLAAQHGLQLSAISGTGVGGRIRKQDVLAAAEAAKKAAEAPAPAPAAAATPAPAAAAAPSAPAAPPEGSKRGTTEKISRMRSVIAKRMVESLQIAAQLTGTVEVDLTNISRLRARAKEDFRKREGASLSYLPFICKAVCESLKHYDKVNATMDIDAGTITYHDAEHLSIAVDTDRGLLVPVIRDAGDLSLGGLAKKIGDLAKRARNNQLGPDEMSGGTFTITNYGSAGTLFDTPIINQPQAAILGTGALVKRPMVVPDPKLGEVIAVRDMMYLSLSYDHRLVDGADAARFLSSVKARLEAGDFAGELGL
ncbi:MAG TPA: 2-oxoglutarate dehydrogenase, E2 component, dihydrolipoamide succinyltransferase [Micropruina sp.]|nr:2-oxoglutarate dehydrogenase, E2 component, dihydrolipoamide succinyltransferase [Micropruina sp.]HMR22163.1 2-oxoglutarate dehydrogenase, E2 component, dihydrolipoamide succinyltransferase [Micropruina sp.]